MAAAGRMIVLAVTFAVVFALALVVVLVLNRGRNDAATGELAAVAAETIATRNQRDAEAQRDAAVTAVARLEAETKALTAQLTATQRDAIAARKELAERVRQSIANGSAADVAHGVDQLLSQPLGPVPATSGGSNGGAVGDSHTVAPLV